LFLKESDGINLYCQFSGVALPMNQAFTGAQTASMSLLRVSYIWCHILAEKPYSRLLINLLFVRSEAKHVCLNSENKRSQNNGIFCKHLIVCLPLLLAMGIVC